MIFKLRKSDGRLWNLFQVHIPGSHLGSLIQWVGVRPKNLYFNRYPHDFHVEDQGYIMIKKTAIEISKVPSTTNFIISRIFQNRFQLVVFIIACYFGEILFNEAYWISNLFLFLTKPQGKLELTRAIHVLTHITPMNKGTDKWEAPL